MDRYAHIIRHILSTPWAIRPEMAAVIQDILSMRRAGVRLSTEEIQARIGSPAAARAGAPAGAQQIAVIPIVGVITHRMELMTDVSASGVSPDMLARSFRTAMADQSVQVIVLDIDSPGGTVFGLMELGDEIRAARGKKLVVAVANGIAASAAYWIGSQAEEFVVTPSGQVGSIGVLSMHENWAEYLKKQGIEISLLHFGKYKVEGNPYGPLGEEARASIQSDLDEYGAMFHRAVSKGRGVPIDKVRSEFGEGRMLMAADALARGMVDSVESFDHVIARLQVRLRKASSAGSAAAELPAAPAADAAVAPAAPNADYYTTKVAIAKRKGAVHGVVESR